MWDYIFVKTAAQVQADTDHHNKAMRMLRFVSMGIVGCYGIALLYKAGAHHYFLPAEWRIQLDGTVKRIADITEPKVKPKRFDEATKYLLSVYSTSAGALLVAASGSFIFFRLPVIPIAVSIAFTVIPGVVVMFVPRQYMTTPGRWGLATLFSFSLGYSFGPVNWVAYDTILPCSLVVGSTIAGFAVPLFLTRGVISYFFSTQLLSCSLSTLSALTLSPTDDVNVMITLQLLANGLLGALHTVPCITEFVRAEEGCPVRGDVLCDALTVFGSGAYAIWLLFRLIFLQICRKISRGSEARKLRQPGCRQEVGFSLAIDADNVSNIAATGLFLLFYIKFVSSLQRSGHTRHGFSAARKVFLRCSPLNWFLQ